MARGANERRVLGSLDLLPEECQDDVVWALARLNERQRTQADILSELNDRLAVKGYGPISKSAFSRRSVRLKRRADRLAERDHLYAGIADKLTPEKMSQADIVLGELLKALIDELAEEASTPKAALELARAYSATVSAQRVSVKLKDEREKALEEAEAKLDRAVTGAADAVRAAGRKVDPAEILEMIRKAYREGG